MDLVQAMDRLYLFRILGEDGSAWKIAFQTESETEESREFETEATKDGNVKSVGAYEASHSLTSFMAKDDEYITKLKRVLRSSNPDKIEVWEIDRSGLDDETTTIKGEYSVDVLTSISTSAGAEGNVEVSIETEVEGAIIDGDVDVTPQLLEILRQITEEREFVQPMEDTGGGVEG